MDIPNNEKEIPFSEGNMYNRITVKNAEEPKCTIKSEIR